MIICVVFIAILLDMAIVFPIIKLSSKISKEEISYLKTQ